MNAQIVATYMAAKEEHEARLAAAQREIDAKPFDFMNSLASIKWSHEALAGGIIARNGGDLEAAIEEATINNSVILPLLLAAR